MSDALPMTAHDRAARWRVYVVQCADSTYYTGITNDLGARIDEHNAGAGAKYTRGRSPVRLVYAELAPDRGAALRRELEIKRMTRARKRALIESRSA